MAKLSEIEGIGDTYSVKLKAAGISSLESLLKTCCEKTGRKNAAEKAGVTEKQILSWVNRADLARIKGIGTQYADLLKLAGVDTVPELAQRNYENLYAKLANVNEKKNLVRKIPTLSQTKDWILQAKKLPRVVTH